MEKVSITCAHCGSMFQIQIPTTGHSERGQQHSPGCMKTTYVRVNNGKIVGTRK